MKNEEKCVVCSGPLVPKYMPMEEWGIKGGLCSKCYSKKINEHYPGDHTRVNIDKD